MQQSNTTASSAARVRAIEVTAGFVIRIPLGAVEDFEAKLENLFSGRVIHREVSPGKIWLCQNQSHEH